MSDELTQKLPPDDEVKTTQPSITAVFELIQDVKRVVDSNAARLSDIESQMKSGFSTLGYKIDALNRGRLQTEADYFNLLHRIEELESKAS